MPTLTSLGPEEPDRPRIGVPRNRPVVIRVPNQRTPNPEQPSDFQTLGQAKTWLRQRIHDGEKCPCCGQMAKIYRRRIHHTIARSLIQVYTLGKKRGAHGWVHVPTAIGPACEVGKARYWSLIEEAAEKRKDGGRAGWWRLTDNGKAFVEGRVKIRTHALIYDSRCLGMEGEYVSIQDALGSKFSYEELMGR